MKKLEIIGYKRANLGKKEAKQLRREANVPCVLYGGEKQVHFHSPMILFRELLYTPDAYLVNLDVEGDEYKCILQDVQFHPVSEMILHADFLEYTEDKPVKMEIPVKPVGNSPGVQVGGRLMTKIRKLKVRALAKDLPDYINVDISDLELGKSVKVKDIKAENFEILNSPSNPVLSVEIPRALRSKKAASGEDDSEEE